MLGCSCTCHTFGLYQLPCWCSCRYQYPVQFPRPYIAQKNYDSEISSLENRMNAVENLVKHAQDGIEKCFDRMLSQNLDSPDERRLQRRYQKYRDALFVFLYRTDVSPTNNVSERLLRPAVIHRKVSGGFRSDWGAKTYAALKSLTDTGALSGISPFDVIQNLSGVQRSR